MGVGIHKWICGLLALVCAAVLLSPRCGAETAVYGVSQDRLTGCDGYGNTNTETGFGDVTADAAAWYGGADLALLPSVDFGTNVQPGDVTDEVLAACLQNDSALAAVLLSPAQVLELLELGYSHVTVAADSTLDREASYFEGYLQISGLTVTYDAAAPVGERVVSARREDGTPLDPEDTRPSLRVVSTVHLLTGGYGYPDCGEEHLEPVGTEREAVAAYFLDRGTVRAPRLNRVSVRGTRDWILHRQGSILLAIAAVCLILVQGNRGRRREDVRSSSRTAAEGELPVQETNWKEGSQWSNMS